jgi:Zn-dependent metalloprotease
VKKVIAFSKTKKGIITLSSIAVLLVAAIVLPLVLMEMKLINPESLSDESTDDTSTIINTINDSEITNSDIEHLGSTGIIEIFRNEDDSIGIINGTFSEIAVNSAEDAANVLNAASELFGENFRADSINIAIQSINSNTTNEESFYKHSPIVNNIPVLGSQIILTTDESGTLQGLFSSYDKRIESINTTPSIDSTQAKETALNAHLNSISGLLDEIADELGIDVTELEVEYLSVITANVQLYIHAFDAPVLVWAVDLESETYYIYANGDMAGDVFVVVSNMQSWTPITISANDLSGNEQNIYAQSQGNRYKLHDTVRNMETHNITFGYDSLWDWIINSRSETRNILSDDTIVSGRLNNSPSPSAVSAHANKAIAYDYYRDILGRESFDGNRERVLIGIDYRESHLDEYNDAMWHPHWQGFFYGNVGNTQAALDVVGHEFTHAVINYVVGDGRYIYLGHAFNNSEAMALNESYSDIMGSLIEGKTCEGRWSFGEDAISNYNRNMSDTSHYSDYLCTDRGNQHNNSRIFSHAAFLMKTNNRTSTISDETWARVFYHSLYRLTTDATFRHARETVIISARTQGFTETQLNAIRDAFDMVGIVSVEIEWVVEPTLEFEPWWDSWSNTYREDSFGFCPVCNVFKYPKYESESQRINERTGEATWEWQSAHGGESNRFIYDSQREIFVYYNSMSGWEENIVRSSPSDFARKFPNFADQLVVVYEADISMHGTLSDRGGREFLLDDAFTGNVAVAVNGEFVTGFIFQAEGSGRREERKENHWMVERTLDVVSLVRHGLHGVVDRNGNVLIPFVLEDIMIIDERTAFARHNGKYGIISLTGEMPPPLQSWQEQYIELIQAFEHYTNSSNHSYSLHYVNDDDVPELVIRAEQFFEVRDGKLPEILEKHGFASNILFRTIVATVHNGEMDVLLTNNFGIFYIERENVFHTNHSGRFGWMWEDISAIQNGKFVQLHVGSYNFAYPYEDEGYMEREGISHLYYWNEVGVTKEEYEQFYSEAFDSSRASWSDSGINATAIIRVIKSYYD